MTTIYIVVTNLYADASVALTMPETWFQTPYGD